MLPEKLQLPKALTERRYRRNRFLRFYREPVRIVRALPGPAVRSPTTRIDGCLRNAQALPSRVFRRLQSYSVQVYRWEREAMEQAGRLECLHDCVYLLSGGLGYAEDTGLDVRMADGISSADLVF